MSGVLWVLNLDAELELQTGPGYNRSARMEAVCKRLLPAARGLLAPGDMSLQDYDGSKPSSTRCWCPTPSALNELASRGLDLPRAPRWEVLRQANHRYFCHAIGGGGVASQWVRSREELEAVVEGDWRAWVLKRPLGMAGRGQRRIHSPPTQTDLHWLTASFRQDGLVAERWLEILAEFSLHGYLAEEDGLSMGRPCRQFLDEYGSFVRSEPARSDDLTHSEHEALVERAKHVASQLQSLGYFGPFGIDAYRGVDPSGRLHFIACSEINARYTMSFHVGLPGYALGLSKQNKHGWDTSA